MPRAWWALLLVSPCVLFALSIAQATCLLALLFIGCLRLAPTRPWAAGLLLGVLSIKPHLCVLIGLVLIVRRQWPVLIAAAGTVLTLAGLSVALFGTGPWLDYVVHTIPYQRLVLEQPFGFVWALMVSPYAWFMQCGAPVGLAALLHMIVAAAIAAVALIASEIARRRRDDDLAIAILALGTVLITPYSLIYDLVIPTAAMFGYLAHTRAAPSRRVTITLALFWAAPMAIMVLAERALPAALPLMLAAFAALCAPALASASLEFGALAGRMRARAVPR